VLRIRRDVLVLAAALIAAGSGCSGTADRSSAAAGPTAAAPQAVGAIPIGPGPRKTYTVQAQPPAGSCHFRHRDGQPLPDTSCTPGALNPDVTQKTLSTTICRKGGYTSGIRPPVSITDAEKRANARSYGYTGSLHDAEYDHLISLQLGGDPNDARNLWVENYRGSFNAHDKDRLENFLHHAVCTGKMPLRAAQEAIAKDWVKAYCEAKLGECPSRIH
jgi:hypothetical protein